jgi:hypothetical protein
MIIDSHAHLMLPVEKQITLMEEAVLTKQSYSLRQSIRNGP